MLALALLAPLLAPPIASTQETQQPAREDRLVDTVPAKHEPTEKWETPSGSTSYTSLPFTFSPAGDRVAFLARKKRRVYAFVDGEDIGWGDAGHAPVFSGDGQHVFTSVVKRNKNRSEKWTVYRDDDVVAREDWVGPLAVSHDAETIAFWTQPSYRLDKQGMVILDRACLVIAHHKKKVYKQTTSKVYEEGNTFDAPVLTENDTRALGNSYWDVAGTIVSVGGRKDEVLFSRAGRYVYATWSPDRKRVATVQRNYSSFGSGSKAELDNLPSYSEYEVMVDGVPMDIDADAWALPTWSANSEHLAFVYHHEKRFGVGLDEALHDVGEDMILRVLPDSSGTRVAWIVHEGGDVSPWIWLNRWAGNSISGGNDRVGLLDTAANTETENEPEPTLGPLFDRIDQLVFSPKEDHLAYTARIGTRWFLVCGEERIGPFDAIGKLRWLDETTLAIGTREDREFWWRTMSLVD